MNTFFTSDQHYGHKNICRFAGRPFNSVEEMDEALIKAHNETVSKTDIVWFVGDFAFSDADRIRTILRRLNGQKNLILGNHDNQIAKTPKAFIGDGLFNSIANYKQIKIGGQAIILMHYAMRIWDKSHYGSWHLYGHSHGTLPPYGKSLDVGVDDKNITVEYRPYSFDEIQQFMSKQNTIIKENSHANYNT